MQRFIVFSDLHLNSWTYGADVSSTWNSRLDGQYLAVMKMFEYARRHSIKSIFFCGDFFHTPSRIDAEVLHAAGNINERAGDLNVYILAGNHDKKSERVSALNALNGGAFTVISEPYWDTTEDGIHWAATPYTESYEDLQRFLDSTDLEGRVVLLHQGVGGVEVNSKGFTLNEILRPEMIPDSILHAFAGHYHTFKRVSPKLTIPGSMMQLNWNDRGEDRGFLDVMVDGSTLHMTRVITPKEICPRFVEVSLSELRNKEDLKDYDYNIVRVVRDQDVPTPAVRTLLSKSVAVEIVDPITESKATEVDVTQFDSMTDLFEEYVEHCALDEALADTGREVINEAT